MRSALLVLALAVGCSNRARDEKPALVPAATQTSTVTNPSPRIVGAQRDGLEAGGSPTCLPEKGDLRCWGRNDFRQPGHGPPVQSAGPVKVEGLRSPVKVALGSEHSCTLEGSCWTRTR